MTSGRAAQALRRPGDQRELGVGGVPGSVVAADLARDDTDRALRHAERRGEIALDAHRAAGARVERVAAARLVPDAQGGARLHRHAGDAVDPRLEPHHVRGAPEGGVRGGPIAGLGVDTDVRRGLLPHERRPRCDRIAGGGHPRHRQGARAVDASEARVRVRRTDQARVGLAGDVDVVAVAPRARDEARVFAAADGLAEALTGRAGAGVEERRHQIRLWTNSTIFSAARVAAGDVRFLTTNPSASPSNSSSSTSPPAARYRATNRSRSARGCAWSRVPWM